MNVGPLPSFYAESQFTRSNRRDTNPPTEGPQLNNPHSVGSPSAAGAAPPHPAGSAPASVSSLAAGVAAPKLLSPLERFAALAALGGGSGGGYVTLRVVAAR
jgi:hypothetical protein